MNKVLQKGFTLIEVMVVVVIMGVLIALVAPNVLGRVDEAKVTAAKTDISTLESALELYKLDNHFFPSTDQGLKALVEKPTGQPEPRNWNQNGYLKKGKLPADPWGTEYQYIAAQNFRSYELYSLGADAQEGGEGYDADIGTFADQ